MTMLRRILCMAIIVLVSIGHNAYADSTDEDLIADIDLLQQRIDTVENEISQYDAGAILNLLTMRREILKTTEEMLQQKRYASTAGISIEYTINGDSLPTITQDQFDVLDRDISILERSIRKNEREASQYSGGLILVMLIVNIATEKTTLSALNMRYLTAKHEIPIFDLGTRPAYDHEKTPVRNIVEDKEGL